MTQPYDLRHTPGALQQLSNCGVRARQLGLFEEYLAASEWIIAELEYSPHQFGESRDIDPTSDIVNRCAGVDPLFVEFMIDDEEHAVYLNRVHWMKKRSDPE